ncbi:hypothetical protein [Pengzhenrongella sicca]|uniref:Uncharacterized protein n=1 Tax=Pengzhenrongella sicca TaxID=2819238 RepID=A0A8A4ZEQ8_9MICO|nr:hypothetical protein [Pengzhenrongella sicca]QTE30460.1 hypothetical protein J4E96_05610 [Pengzhenrongella sicca]
MTSGGGGPGASTGGHVMTADDLVGAVRGRRLCYELALRGSNGDDVRSAMGAEASRVHAARGDGGRTVLYLVAATTDELAPEPRPARALSEVLADAAPGATVGPRELLAALADTVTSAMGWQPPDAEDVVLTHPAVRAGLGRIADAVLADPHAAWWSEPVAREAQVRIRFEPATVARAPRGTAAERLHRWRDGVLEEERAAVGGTWWVTPALAGLDLTTRALGDAGSASLWLTEDEQGWESAELVPCAVDVDARVLEIDGPQAWASLVATYPLTVTSSRGPDWFGTVPARAGDWTIPDWSAVSADYDGVHVSVLAWLTTSGQAVPVGRGATTTLAGWDPDATWWLGDRLRPAETHREWVRRDRAWLPTDSAR